MKPKKRLDSDDAASCRFQKDECIVFDFASWQVGGCIARLRFIQPWVGKAGG
jgi:hypothetical protein